MQAVVPSVEPLEQEAVEAFPVVEERLARVFRTEFPAVQAAVPVPPHKRVYPSIAVRVVAHCAVPLPVRRGRCKARCRLTVFRSIYKISFYIPP